MGSELKRPGPILALDRFPELRALLLELLASLAPNDWERPTAAPLWSVRDVAAHLLGGDIGMLSRRRDGFTPPGKPIRSEQDLIDLINHLNDTWVRATRRMSGPVICDLLAHTGPQVEAYFASLDPFALGDPVSWAGPAPAPVWLDLAREFTERWHHQQQIRDATGRAPLYDPRFLAPVIDAFVRALPHSFREVQADEGAVIKLEITGSSGGCWFLRRDTQNWEIFLEASSSPSAEVLIPQDVAWRLFTKGLRGEEAAQRSVIRGDSALVAKVFGTIAIIG
jgi:uncharacterized protein (TIGR03083 family)